MQGAGFDVLEIGGVGVQTTAIVVPLGGFHCHAAERKFGEFTAATEDGVLMTGALWGVASGRGLVAMATACAWEIYGRGPVQGRGDATPANQGSSQQQKGRPEASTKHAQRTKHPAGPPGVGGCGCTQGTFG